MQERPGASSTTSDARDERLPQGRPAGPPVDVRATQVLITEQEMVFGTAAAVAPQRQRAGHPSSPACGKCWRGRETHPIGVRIPRRTISSAPAFLVKSTAYEHGRTASDRRYS